MGLGASVSAPRPLSPDVDLSQFTCGDRVLDDWLRLRAAANQASGASHTFIVQDGSEVLGYYALASGGLTAAEAPGGFRRNMPEPIPVAILARLAVAEAWHGRGMGRFLFVDAARRVLQASEAIGIRGLLVHAISDEAAEFYRRLGLQPSPINPLTLVVKLSDLRASIGPPR